MTSKELILLIEKLRQNNHELTQAAIDAKQGMERQQQINREAYNLLGADIPFWKWQWLRAQAQEKLRAGW